MVAEAARVASWVRYAGHLTDNAASFTQRRAIIFNARNSRLKKLQLAFIFRNSLVYHKRLVDGLLVTRLVLLMYDGLRYRLVEKHRRM